MRVAVASQDGETISAHFGRCACFIIFDIEDGKALLKEVRQNAHSHDGEGNCHNPGHCDQPHSHAALCQTLHDCQAALCYGMGWRAADELRQNGIQPVIVDRKRSPEETVALYAQGKLVPADSAFCAPHHPHHD